MQPAFFLAGNHARNGVRIVVAFKNLFTLGTCFQVFHSIRICDRSAQFLVLVTSNGIKSRKEHERTGNEI